MEEWLHLPMKGPTMAVYKMHQCPTKSYRRVKQGVPAVSDRKQGPASELDGVLRRQRRLSEGIRRDGGGCFVVLSRRSESALANESCILSSFTRMPEFTDQYGSTRIMELESGKGRCSRCIRTSSWLKSASVKTKLAQSHVLRSI